MIFKYAIKNIVRQHLHSLLMISVAFILFLFYSRFIMNIKADEAEIDHLYQTVEVTGEIKQREGTSLNAQIPLDLVNQIVSTGFIQHEVLDTKYYAFTFPLFNVSADKINNNIYVDVSNQPYIIGVSDLNKSYLLPKGMKINFAEGYNAEMFSKDQSICIVSRQYMEDYGFSYGDRIGILGEFSKEYTMYGIVPPEDIVKELSKGYVFTICGSYENDTLSFGNNVTMLEKGDVIVPARAVLDHFDKLYYYEETNDDMYLRGTYDFIREPLVHRASFTLKNTRELETFRQFLKDNDLTDTATGNSKYMFELNDGQLINTIRPLQSSLNFKKSLLGLIYFLICIISFFLSFLSAHRRLGYIAILRSLGTSRLHTFWQILLEHILLGGSGLLMALFISILNIQSFGIPILYILIYYFIYLSGCMIALIYILKVSTIKILTKGAE